MNSYKELVVWHRSMDLVVAIYGVTQGFPRAEQFGLASQLQRAAVSIPSNCRRKCSKANQGLLATYLYRVRIISGAGNTTRDSRSSWIRKLGI